MRGKAGRDWMASRTPKGSGEVWIEGERRGAGRGGEGREGPGWVGGDGERSGKGPRLGLGLKWRRVE